MKITFKIPKEHKGGPGSGNFGHSGRPGKVGGSGPGGGFGAGAAQVVGPYAFYDAGALAQKYPKVYEAVLAGRPGKPHSKGKRLTRQEEDKFVKAEAALSKLSAGDFEKYTSGGDEIMDVYDKVPEWVNNMVNELFENG